ncbi:MULTISPECIES: VOC family protein [Nonomuraea]|uniref:VOC family protein n=1 Tax=Nonomuraea ferruginea TaxID=46174 RepID=A0ABT4T8D9_9ACTN|nr:VOC family protein [Nonomuraea ferruginea]MDA0645600.1 VOC family protein [Nonomuraea ferruginea]
MTAYSLDHVALAVRSWTQGGPVLAGRFGGRWRHGFEQAGAFNPAQIEYANGMRVELLQPGSDPASFVRRFLDGTGARARPHHITFKVRDIRASLGAAGAAGFEPILVNLDFEGWQEAFLHPKDTGLGFLVQMAQAEEMPEELAGDMPGLSLTPPWPEPEVAWAALPAVAGQVSRWDPVRRVLRDVLGGAETPLEPGISRFTWPSGADLVLATGEEPGLRALAFRGDGAVSWELADVLRAAAQEPIVPELGIRVADLASQRVAG